tara:strand:- start:1423 stop:2778 length:1356 start_codon:yes stop_codon:yes gene_type:complete
MSKIEVNTIEPQCGTTLTLGGSGDTVTLASGASQSGFGRTGTVDWQTSIKTAASFTAVNGEGYFVDTSSNAVTANLPAGSAGAIVSFKDYAQNFDTNALTIAANGSEKIDGLTTDLLLSTEGIAVTLVYGDATKGWQAVNSNEITNVLKYVTATGGTITTCGNYKIHTFTGPGTFCVSCAGSVAGSNTVDYLVVAGGGSGGADNGGGGGAGGFRLSNDTCMPAPLTSPLANSCGLSVPATAYPITVGAGGAATAHSDPARAGNRGSNSVFSSITSAGGGGGAQPSPVAPYAPGGSGGGDRAGAGIGTGNTPPVSPPQGNDGGGPGPQPNNGGGGGGAGAVGSDGAPAAGGPGGVGSYVLNGAGFAGCNGTTGPVTSARYFAGGGGGAPDANPGQPPGGSGGSGGGGAGSYRGGPAGTAATTNTGGGGGGGGNPNASGAGGSGIVIIRYKYQ